MRLTANDFIQISYLWILIHNTYDFQLRRREKVALNYSEALKEKFASHPEIRRIARHRQIPKHIYNAQQELRAIKDKGKRKQANRRAHSKKGSVPFVPERRKHVVREHE